MTARRALAAGALLLGTTALVVSVVGLFRGHLAPAPVGLPGLVLLAIGLNGLLTPGRPNLAGPGGWPEGGWPDGPAGGDPCGGPAGSGGGS
ncbi:hypothetical protein [Micromonospora siamensis]|uniref:Uncharacterized protein n=1 Tax=Micromonospora siamensis TaxID=299152 RepID=A0A1C5JPP8_9ACTN|nr:hypothetical protein [Micromonospora siamensis]SCG72555.1 hypothetical protein GA0074704_4779 [Micromonospora siamensis]